MLLIDANIFIELILGKEKADECEKFLEKVASVKLEALISKFKVHAVEPTQ
jgi:predicted nucleic acid-binding protein